MDCHGFVVLDLHQPLRYPPQPPLAGAGGGEDCKAVEPVCIDAEIASHERVAVEDHGNRHGFFHQMRRDPVRNHISQLIAFAQPIDMDHRRREEFTGHFT